MLRLGLLGVAGVAFCFALSSNASADVVEPSSAYQPASTGLIAEKDAAQGEAETTPLGDSTKPAPLDAPTPKEEKKPAKVVEATPAPEQVVTQAPAHLVRPRPVAAPADENILERAIRPLRGGFQQVGSYLGRVVSACQVATGSGAGGPALILAVLCVAVALERRGILWIRPTTDEDAPGLLFARELICPG